MDEVSEEKRRVTARVHLVGVDVSDSVTDEERPNPIMISFDRADYTRPLMDEVALEVDGGSCSCYCSGSSGSGSGGCCSCLGSQGVGH